MPGASLYDLIIRDATIVSSAGRLVADVAIKDGKIAYVGPRPPREAKRELSAIGKFLLPGVIDTGACLAADGDPAAWAHESRAAVSGGTTTVFALPGTNATVDAQSASAALGRLQGKSWCHHGLWIPAQDGGATAAIAATAVPGVVGVLATLGGPAGLDPAELAGFADAAGVLAVRYLGDPDSLRPNADGVPERSPAAMAVMRLVRELGRSVHWSHLSTSEELDLIDPVRGDLPLTNAVTPHHLFLSQEEDEGVVLQPPLRSEQHRRTLWTAIKRGRLDCLASDHHTVGREGPGAPSAELLFPLMLSAVRLGRMSLEQLAAMCCEVPAKIFGLESKGRIVRGADADLLLFSEDVVARIDQSTLATAADWSPYDGREAAPKPDLVMVAGQTTAVRGEVVGDKPIGVVIT